MVLKGWFSYDRPDRLCRFCRLQSLTWLEQANFLKRQKWQRRSGRSYENQALKPCSPLFLSGLCLFSLLVPSRWNLQTQFSFLQLIPCENFTVNVPRFVPTSRHESWRDGPGIAPRLGSDRAAIRAAIAPRSWLPWFYFAARWAQNCAAICLGSRLNL